MRTLRLLGAVTMLSAFLAPYSAGQTTFTKLHKFGEPPDGENPGGVVPGPNGVFYGMTSDGGDTSVCSYFGCGTIFELQPPAAEGGAWTEAVLYAFSGQNESGAAGYPVVGPLVGPNGVLYGATAGGAFSSGSVFALQPPAGGTGSWTETILYTFAGVEASISSLLMNRDGALYGTTWVGGAYGEGSVFKLAPPSQGGTAWAETDLYSFTGGSDGNGPRALVPSGTGSFYGLTYSGGNWGAGTVFEVTPPSVAGGAWTESVLYAFTGGADGAGPWTAALTLSDGNLFGATHLGGASGYGAVFQLAPPSAPGGAWTQTVLFSFGQGHGYGPDSPLIVWKGNIYGTASLLCTGDPILGSNGCGGLAFELRKPAAAGDSWTEKGLHSFYDDDIPYGTQFMDQYGALYGVTLDSNGYPGAGYVYRLTR